MVFHFHTRGTIIHEHVNVNITCDPQRIHTERRMDAPPNGEGAPRLRTRMAPREYLRPNAPRMHPATKSMPHGYIPNAPRIHPECPTDSHGFIPEAPRILPGGPTRPHGPHRRPHGWFRMPSGRYPWGLREVVGGTSGR